jgi:hypothetical protein
MEPRMGNGVYLSKSMGVESESCSPLPQAEEGCVYTKIAEWE